MLAVAVVLGGVAVGGTAMAADPEPAEPIGQPVHDARGRRHPLAPIPFFYRELDQQRVNTGLNGRKNALRDEQRVAETPSLQPRPLSSW
jgi:hypothetical protein